MLTVLKDELKRLAADPQDEFHVQIRKRIGKRATLILEKRLKQLILLMPGLVKRIHGHWRSENSSAKIKELGGFLLAYLYHPKDFLPEDKYGLFGYLDDAYLTAIVYELAFLDEQNISQEDLAFLEKIKAIKKYVKAVIPLESDEIEAMVSGAVKSGKYDKFAAVFKGAA